MGKIAFIFPGQGAQYVGMGRDFAGKYSSVMKMFREADDILNMDLSSLIFEGTNDDLQQTEITQPAILTTSIAILQVIQEHNIRPDAVAGLSLGEYSALVAGNALDFKEAVPLVQKRGRYMQEAVPTGKGLMAAILGLDRKSVEQLCYDAKAYGIVEPANYNCPGQIVISGEKKAVQKACSYAREMGAKRAVELNVSAPFHCSMMKSVEKQLAAELSKVHLRTSQVSVVTNVNAKFLTNKEEIKEALIKQVSNPILWEDSVNHLLEKDFDVFIEIGPGRVLTGFIKRISRKPLLLNVEKIDDLPKVIGSLKEGKI